MNGHKQSEIDRESAVPLYIQLKEIIKGQIAEGILQEGKLIPSERKLCSIYNISHITVRQALVELTEENILFRVPGRGTYVKDGNRPSAGPASLPIGIVIPETKGMLASSFVSDLLLGLKSVTAAENCSIMMYLESETNYLLDMEARKLGGLVLTDPMARDARILMIKRMDVPLVVIGRTDIPDVISVDNDNVWIGRKVTSHLIESGYRKIGFINGPRDFSISEDRLSGYRESLEQNMFDYDEELVKYGEFSEEDGYRLACELFDAGSDAVACADDLIAVGALKAARAKGFKVPEEAGIAGCNNSALAEHVRPPLTTVDICIYTIGKTVGRKLMQLIKRVRCSERTILKGELIVRQSTEKGRVEAAEHVALQA